MKTFCKIIFLSVFFLKLSSLFSQSDDSAFTNVGWALENPLKVKKLDLFNQHLKNIDGDLSKFENLETLVLVDNPDLNFETVLKQVSYCKKLTTLFLDDNKLTSLPKSLGKLTSLKTLELSYNNFTTLDPAVLLKLKKLNNLLMFSCLKLKMKKELVTISKLPNLEYLALMQNKLTELPPQIKYCKELRKLDLQSNRLKTLPVEVSEMTNLQEISLVNNKIKYLPAQLNKINLKVVDLAYNDISLEKLASIQKTFPATNILVNEDINGLLPRTIATPF